MSHGTVPVPPTPPPSSRPADDHLPAVRGAHATITSDLSLDSMPTRIVEAACTLLEAGQGAFVITGYGGVVADCVHQGFDEGAVGHLADIVESGEHSPFERVDLLRRHGFLAARVHVRGTVFGELYVGAGAAGDAVGQELIGTLAAIAGTALENAVLYEEARRSKDWLNASGEIARALLANHGEDTLMDVVLRALHVAEADAAALVLVHDMDTLKVVVTAGIGADDFRGVVIDPARSALGRAIASGESLLVGEMSAVARDHYENAHEYGPVMVAPMVDPRGVRGAVVLCRTLGRVEFSGRDLDLATTFADQVSLALEMAEARSDGESLRVLEDRHRIAQDLHDNVMQRLFATGVGLQSLAAGGLAPEIARRLGRYIDDIDETIHEIRDRVFGLRATDVGPARRAPTHLRRPSRTDTTPDTPPGGAPGGGP